MIDTINGYRIYEQPNMKVKIGEDWSKVRSPARARRRMKKHRQNIVNLYRPSDEYILDEQHFAIHCHPAAAMALRAHYQHRSIERRFFDLSHPIGIKKPFAASAVTP